MSTATRQFFTYSQISRIAHRVQRIRGAQLITRDNNIVSLPNDALVRAIDDVNNQTVLIQASGTNLTITRMPHNEGTSTLFSVSATYHKDKRTREELPSQSQSSKVKEYHIFADYCTSFIWSGTDSGRYHLDDPTKEYDKSLAERVIAWSEEYNTSFHKRGLDQGEKTEVFDTVDNIASWTLEGALLSIGIAHTTVTPVVYSAYLKNKIRFSGDEYADGEEFVKLVHTLKDHLALDYLKYDEILS